MSAAAPNRARWPLRRLGARAAIAALCLAWGLPPAVADEPAGSATAAASAATPPALSASQAPATDAGAPSSATPAPGAPAAAGA
ncbi:MAG TPA: hypothetical protein PK072_17445, partial [Quisquiliibacterium sp.]|nr:hypothetical protein [Quisquiliibacterium sp.]